MKNRPYSISLSALRDLLEKRGLLRGISVDGRQCGKDLPEKAPVFSKLSFDSREIAVPSAAGTPPAETLFFVKGANFRPEYLHAAFEAGLKAFAAEEGFHAPPQKNGVIAISVSDVKKAMAAAAMEFYDNPQKKLFVTGITGTKGKTTTAYFAKNILDQAAGKKTALLSTLETTLDGTNFFKSALTTPESIDLYRMMAAAAENGMTHLVMEVSSQAYKLDRVFDLTFDAGVFLNISPDHIGPIEHPDFDDYFLCKRQLLRNSKKIVLNKNSAHFETLLEEAKSGGGEVFVFGSVKEGTNLYFEADNNEKENDAVNEKKENAFRFTLRSGDAAGFPEMRGAYSIPLEGNFNGENALAAALACRLAGARPEDIAAGLSTARIPGRMEKLTQKNGAAVYVDYAHNGVSLEALLGVLRAGHSGRIIALIGATGGKGQSRRKDIGAALGKMADIAVLTADDPAFEDPQAIVEEIRAAIVEKIETHIIIDRKEAIRFALSLAKNKNDAVAIAGKGADMFQIVGDKKVPYEGDRLIAEKIINSENERQTNGK